MNIEFDRGEIALLAESLRYAKRSVSEGSQEYAGKRQKLDELEKLEAKLRNSSTHSPGQE